MRFCYVKKKKILQQIDQEKQQLETIKQELIFIKSNLEDKTPKIDVSNIYVWENNGLFSIVRLNEVKLPVTPHSKSLVVSSLIDIFTNNVIYKKCSLYKVQRCEYISADIGEAGYYAHFYPIYDVDNNILAYADKKVPLYILQQLYYKLNNVDINADILKKTKSKNHQKSR